VLSVIFKKEKKNSEKVIEKEFLKNILKITTGSSGFWKGQ
jgi:hypothetical protein